MGEVLANMMFSPLRNSLSRSSSHLSSSSPVMISGCLWRSIIPAILAMASAVTLLSPVIIMTLMPAALHLDMASGISFLGGSIMPASPMKTKPPSLSKNFSEYASASTLSPLEAMRS